MSSSNVIIIISLSCLLSGAELIFMNTRLVVVECYAAQVLDGCDNHAYLGVERDFVAQSDRKVGIVLP